MEGRWICMWDVLNFNARGHLASPPPPVLRGEELGFYRPEIIYKRAFKGGVSDLFFTFLSLKCQMRKNLNSRPFPYIWMLCCFSPSCLGLQGHPHFLELALPAVMATTFSVLVLEQIPSVVTGDDHCPVWTFGLPLPPSGSAHAACTSLTWIAKFSIALD